MRATPIDRRAGTETATEMIMMAADPRAVLHPTGFILLNRNSVFTSRREEPQ